MTENKRSQASNQRRGCGQVYVASAMMEFRFLPTKEDTRVPRNIFELGLANYLTEPAYVLQYADFLLSVGDLDNLRALLERALAVTPPPAALPLYDRYILVRQVYICHWVTFLACRGDFKSANTFCMKEREKGFCI